MKILMMKTKEIAMPFHPFFLYVLYQSVLCHFLSRRDVLYWSRPVSVL